MDWKNVDCQKLYTSDLQRQPVSFDPEKNRWLVYSYNHCKKLLQNPSAIIPSFSFTNSPSLNPTAKILVSKLCRISNGNEHHEARKATIKIYQVLRNARLDEIVASQMTGLKKLEPFDWVETVALKLPVLTILKSLAFCDVDANWLLNNLFVVVKILSPLKTPGDIESFNKIIYEFYIRVKNWFDIHRGEFMALETSTGQFDQDDLFICNLIGLLIQAYDAGRGLLTNALIWLNKPDNIGIIYKPDLYDLVLEVLRIDPPVHNTMRLAADDIVIGGQIIKKGQLIMIMIASANLDPEVFYRPRNFNLRRKTNNRHLTFGFGGHECIARELMMNISVEVLHYFRCNFSEFEILQKNFEFESRANVRLIKELVVRL
jgi:cytochrome P450